MQASAKHPNESERLEDLYDYGILDAAAEKIFHDVAELAAAMCGFPYAVVTLVDQDRQWFKAQYGINIEGSKREESVCGHAILATDVFEVPDARLDVRFKDNPLFRRDPEIRFYGGCQLRSDRGNPIGMLCVLDSRPHKLTQAQRNSLRQLSQLLMAVIEAGRKTRLLNWFGALVDDFTDEIYITDPDRLMFLHANRSAQLYTGYSLSRLKQMSPMDLTGDPNRYRFEEYVRRLRAGELLIRFNSIRRRIDGNSYPVEVRWQLLSTHGRPVILAYVRDISEQSKVEQLKDEFIARVNHELRTPLTSIVGAVKLLQQGAAGTLPVAAQRLVHLAADNTERLRHIVDEVLDLERIASGKMSFHAEVMQATVVLKRAAEGYETAAIRLGVTLAIDADEALWLRADARRLHQVLSNLISNACKFSSPGMEVRLVASRSAEDGFVRLAILDEGPGVPDNFRTRIFERFAQADMKNTRSKGGSGLGLAIARQMTEQMGGKVGYESLPGHTIFYADFPAAQP